MRTPTRHVVMSFVSADDATAAVLLLHELGLTSADVASYTPVQMRARAAEVLGRTSPPTPPGLVKELVIAQRELARRGHSFVLVRTGSELLLQGIDRIAAEAHAHSVQTSPSRISQDAPAQPIASSMPTGRWRTAARPSTTP